MSKRKSDTGFGDEIDTMLEESDDEEGVLMTGGAEAGGEEEEEEEEDEEEGFVGAQPSMTGEYKADSAMDEENEGVGDEMEDKDGPEKGESGTELDGERNEDHDEYLAEDDEEELPDTENVEGSENILNMLGLNQQTQQTQLDSVEPSTKMKKLAMQRARARVKRATAMYMLFSIDVGSRLEKGTSFKDRAAIIKKQYQEMVEVPEQMEVWTAKAVAERERFEREIKAAYEEELAALQTDGMPEDAVITADASLSSLSKMKDLILPLARVKKTVKMDPDVKNIAKDGAVAMTKATELFIAYLGIKCAAVSALRGGKTIQERDFIHLVNSNKTLDFLQEDFPRRAEDDKKKKSSNYAQLPADGGGSEAVDGEKGAQGAAPALRKKSRLEAAAEGSAQLNSFFSKAPAGAPLAPAPLREISKPSKAIEDILGSAGGNGPTSSTPSKGKRGSRGGRSGETDSGAKAKARTKPRGSSSGGEDLLNTLNASDTVSLVDAETAMEEEGVADNSGIGSAAKKGRSGKKGAKGALAKLQSKSVGDGGGDLMAMFGAKSSAAGSGFKPAADIEDLL